MTLLSWEGKITYDGIVLHPKRLPNEQLSRTLKAYINAVDEHRLITSLPKLPPGFVLHAEVNKQTFTTLQCPILSHEEVRRVNSIRSVMKSILDLIGNSPTTQRVSDIQSMVIFRRVGYTEESNPSHLIEVVFYRLSPGTPPIFTHQTHSLLPTVAEYLEMTKLYVHKMHEKPAFLAVDAKEIFAVVQELLSPMGITVIYYPPLSAEEVALNDVESAKMRGKTSFIDVDVCAMCGRTSTAEGKKLYQCPSPEFYLIN
jgi:hypothetical protein